MDGSRGIPTSQRRGAAARQSLGQRPVSVRWHHRSAAQWLCAKGLAWLATRRHPHNDDPSRKRRQLAHLDLLAITRWQFRLMAMSIWSREARTRYAPKPTNFARIAEPIVWVRALRGGPTPDPISASRSERVALAMRRTSSHHQP